MNCSYCLKDLENSLVTKIECDHVFCIKCSSVFCGVLKDTCPKCGDPVRRETIFFYRSNDVPLWRIVCSKMGDRMGEESSIFRK